jgi:hypothetical protein
MSGLVGNPFLLTSAGAAGYQISRSLRFNSSDSAYLSRTPASAGNRKTWTWAGWAKRGSVGSSYEILFSARAGTSSNRDYLTFQSDQLVLTCSNSSGTTTANIQTTSVYRDPGAGMHIVLSVDTTQATASNRVKFYVNGAQVTTFSLANYPTQNTDLSFNDAQPHTIGQSAAGTAFGFNGYLADIHFIDGQALDPTSFGEFSATTGVWVPKAFSGSYGTNGFRLTFADNSAATATTLGKDAAGSNNWTPSNFSVTAGAGNDSLVDVPVNGAQTDTGVGGEVRGNYCTWNPLDNGGVDLSNGNLGVSNGAAHEAVRSTFKLPANGKWYAECTLNSFLNATNVLAFGVDYSNATAPAPYTATGNAFIAVNTTSLLIKIDANEYTTSASTTGAVLRLAYNADTQNLWLGFNGNWYDTSFGTTGNPATGTTPTKTSVAGGFLSASVYQSTGDLNAGQRPFAYTAPSGFKALCTANLPAPTIVKPSTVMDVKLYTGNGSTQTISGLGFSPDLVWMKVRSIGYNHTLIDSVRGATKTLSSSMTVQEYTEPTGPTAFTSDGWSMSGDVTYVGSVNANGQTYAGWCWDAGSSTVTNTQGSITSQVRANASAGFSIVTYTGTGSNATVGHGLGVAPFMFIVKNRDVSSDWDVYHGSLASPATNRIVLQSTAAAIGAGGTSSWNSTSPTSTVVSLGSSTSGNANGNKHVMYCFAPVAGYSAMGSYTGNGSSTDGPFVFCNFRPKFLLIKRTDTSGYPWVIVDAARDGYNLTYKWLEPNSSSAEQTTQPVADADFLSNGFKLRGNGNTTNQSSGTYIYFAVAESPFNYARAR